MPVARPAPIAPLRHPRAGSHIYSAEDIAVKVVATRLTALLAGIWAGFGLSLLGPWFSSDQPMGFIVRFLSSLIFGVVFVFVPGKLFVRGLERERQLRWICWFLGVLGSAVLFSLVVDGKSSLR